MEHYTLDGVLFSTLVANGCQNLKNDVERINNLNVFPVPDGDTGTNMKMTIEGGVNATYNDNDTNIGDVSKKMARAMTMSARGNSGVILSQFFKGVALGLEGHNSVDARGLLEAFESGVAQSYKVVKEPTEGTILTVMREATEEVRKNVDSLKTIEDFFRVFIAKAHKSLENTPNLLAVLKEAGVIDSGGAGYNCIIEGMIQALDGKILERQQEEEAKAKAPTLGAFNADSVLEYGYCTEFILQLQNAKVNIKEFQIKTITDFLETIGNSIVAFKDDDIVKVHVHTFTPGKVIDFCQQFGEYVTFKMENMSVQHNEIGIANQKKKEHQKYAVVAVSPSNGISNVFNEMGCDEIVSGGQTMNPSSSDFIEAFEKLDAEYIFVFPNNSNIIMAAKQAAENYDKANVIVILTKSIAQCYSALSMIDYSSDDLATIINNFNDTIDNVTSGSITYSIRDCTIDNIDIKKGEYISIVDGKLVAASKSKLDAIKDLLKSVEDIEFKEVLTLIYGKDVTEDEKDEVVAFVNENYPDLEVGGIDGNQDVYSYILALE